MNNLLKLMTVFDVVPPVPPVEPVVPPVEPVVPPVEPVVPPVEPVVPPVEPVVPPVEPVVPPVEPVVPPVDPPVEPVVPPVIEKAEDYVVADGIPTSLKEFAFANKLTQVQLDASILQMGQYIAATQEHAKGTLRAEGEAFIKNWGEDGPAKLSIAKRALAQNDPEGTLTKALNESGYGNHPALLEFLHTIGNFMQEGGFLKSEVRKGKEVKTAAQTMYPNHPTKDKP